MPTIRDISPNKTIRGTPRAYNLCDTVDKLFVLAIAARIVPLAKAAVVLSVSAGSSNNLCLPLITLRDTAENFQALIHHIEQELTLAQRVHG
jgi:hypothetical protein